MSTHHLKIEQRWYDRIAASEKLSEIRLDDRDYQTGDVLVFRDPRAEWHVEQRSISHVLRAAPGLADGYVILSMADPRVDHLRAARDRAYEANTKQGRTISGLRGRINMLNNQIGEQK